MSGEKEYFDNLPKPPFPKQAIDPPGLEADMNPRPKFDAPKYRAAGKLEKKVALITGGDSGIGRSVAVLFAREGADVVFTYLSEEQEDAEETVSYIEAEGQRAVAVKGDLRDYEFCNKCVSTCIDEFGKLDILVNNAAYQKHQKGIAEISVEQLAQTINTNILGTFYMVKAADPYLKKGSVIINTGSITGLEGSGNLLDYSATKGAIHAFTKSLAKNLVDRGIRVNCVAPGPVWTPLNPAERSDKETKNFGKDTPMGRPAQPEEIAPTFVFLASEADSSYMTGEVISLLGGDVRAN